MSTETATKTDEPCKKIYVGNLAENVTTEDLTQLFGLSATPYLRSSCSIELKKDQKGKSKGFAFVNVPEHVSGDLLKLHNIEFYEQALVIEESKTAQSGNKGGFRGRGGYRNGGRRNYRYRTTKKDKYETPAHVFQEKIQKGEMKESDIFDIIDCGANLTSPKFHKYYPLVMGRAIAGGVKKFVCTGLTLNGCKNAVIKTHINVDTYASVGIHPHHAKDWSDATRDALIKMVDEEKQVVAIGEVGLDYCKKYSDVDQMKTAFTAQCQIAFDKGKPLLVHERDAFEDVKEILGKFNWKSKNIPVVMYCMTGSVEQIKAYLDADYYIGITGYVCKEHGKHIREAIKSGELPLNKIMLHSDAPHMMPNQSNPDELTKKLNDLCFDSNNEPHTLHVTVRQIASVLGKEPKDVAQQLNRNAQMIYRF